MRRRLLPRRAKLNNKPQLNKLKRKRRRSLMPLLTKLRLLPLRFQEIRED